MQYKVGDWVECEVPTYDIPRGTYQVVVVDEADSDQPIQVAVPGHNFNKWVWAEHIYSNSSNAPTATPENTKPDEVLLAEVVVALYNLGQTPLPVAAQGLIDLIRGEG